MREKKDKEGEGMGDNAMVVYVCMYAWYNIQCSWGDGNGKEKGVI